MHLPQELIDHIIDFLHDNPRTLAQVSLVSRTWVSPARTHLCEALNITSGKLQSSDLSYLAPLCGYVKTLQFTWPTDISDPSVILDCFEQSEPYTLVISSCVELRVLDEETIRRYFTKFPCRSITTLKLHHISPIDETPLVLLSLFPNVDDLAISVASPRKVGPVPGLDADQLTPYVRDLSSPPLRGSFEFSDPSGYGFRTYRRGKPLRIIAALPLHFHTVSLNVKEQSLKDVLIFLGACSKTARGVFLEFGPYKSPGRLVTDWPPVDFLNLEELCIRLWSISGPHSPNIHLILQSVVSPRIRRVIIEIREIMVSAAGWPLLDESLANMFERHEAYGILTIQILTKAESEHVRGLLPRVARRGTLEPLTDFLPLHLPHYPVPSKLNHEREKAENTVDSEPKSWLVVYRGYRGVTKTFTIGREGGGVSDVRTRLHGPRTRGFQIE